MEMFSNPTFHLVHCPFLVPRKSSMKSQHGVQLTSDVDPKMREPH